MSCTAYSLGVQYITMATDLQDKISETIFKKWPRKIKPNIILKGYSRREKSILNIKIAILRLEPIRNQHEDRTFVVAILSKFLLELTMV
jgi:hypothetical protein